MDNTNLNLQEKIQRFVNNELEEDSRRILLEQANADATIADELEFSQSLSQVLRHQDLVAASVVLRNIIAEEGPIPVQSNPSPNNKWWIWGTSLVLLLLCAMGGYLLVTQTNIFASKTQKISRNTLVPLDNVLYVPRNGQGLADLENGMTAYQDGHYQVAAALLTAYSQQHPDNVVNLYIGVSQLMLHQTKSAISALARAVQSEEPPVKEAASWYLSLAYLEDNQINAALEILNAIPADGIYGNQARDLIQKLK